jgi:hypothetical protein
MAELITGLLASGHQRVLVRIPDRCVRVFDATVHFARQQAGVWNYRLAGELHAYR